MKRQRNNEKKAAGGTTLQQPEMQGAATLTTQRESSRGTAEEQVKTTEQKFKDRVLAQSPFLESRAYLVNGRKIWVTDGYPSNSLELALEVAAILSKYAADIDREKRLMLPKWANTEGGCLPLCDFMGRNLGFATLRGGNT
jgi:hypothetical protein